MGRVASGAAREADIPIPSNGVSAMPCDVEAVAKEKSLKRGQRQARERREDWVLRLFGTGMAGLAVFVVGVIDANRAFLPSGLSTTQGTVLEAELQWYPGRRGASSSQARYNVDVRYSYEVSGESYTRIDRYPKRTLLLDAGLVAFTYYKNGAKAVADGFPKGRKITVAYDPSAPKTSRLDGPLEADFRRNALIELIAGIALTLGGFIASRMLKRLGFARGTRLEKPLDEPGIHW